MKSELKSLSIIRMTVGETKSPRSPTSDIDLFQAIFVSKYKSVIRN
jgi:hypothetical protein